MADNHDLGNVMSFSVRHVLRNIFAILIALIGLFVLFVLVSGTKGYAVQSDSMAPRLVRGDVVFVRRIAFEELAVGDIISAHFPDGSGVFTHRVTGIDADKRQIQTRGDHTLSDDPMATDESNIIGKLWFSLPYVGFLSFALEERTLIYICLGVAIVLIMTRIILSARKTESRGV